MIKPIMKDQFFLQQVSKPATVDDLPTVCDLRDTLQAHAAECVGMAANMIGVRKRIIAFDDDGKLAVMLNPQLLSKAGAYEAEEGCLSLSGVRATTRYRTIKVEFQNEHFETHCKTYRGWTAQIIQHEIDHCDGILI